MMFQMLFGHECYMSHDTRTIFCKKLVWLAYKAQERMKRRLQGEKEAEAEDEEANLFEPEWMDDDGEALQESDVEDGAVMVAVPLKGKGAADVAYAIALEIEYCRITGRPYTGGAADIFKCFD